ncbi:RidA family protein [Mucilaginibacter lutimaris]|uniref:RidA family protein n=1 Tax=Mucilaginibacter lutimaris TaxID=931629 RepID=A0ABW2ZEF4_9SPHI
MNKAARFIKQALIIMFSLIWFLTITVSARGQDPDDLLRQKGIVLPALPGRLGSYTAVVRSGNLLYLSGKGPVRADGSDVTGKLGKDLDISEGYAAARLCGLAQLSALKENLGKLSRIKQIIKVTGFVNGTDSFYGQPMVMDGYSDLMTEIFGTRGIHARSAVGVAALPKGWPVEVEMIVEIGP